MAQMDEFWGFVGFFLDVYKQIVFNILGKIIWEVKSLY